MSELGQAIGQRIKALRGERTQVVYARAVGLAQSIVCRAERGESLPNVESLIAIAQEASVSLDWLCLGEGPGPESKGSRGRSGRA